MNRIEKRFKELKRNKKKAFIAFITAGYPNLNTTARLIKEFERIGVDIVELGVPFSDPMADGPIIQEASQQALRKDVHLIDILNLVKKVRPDTNIPICLMTYYNPIFCFGEERFVRKARESGVDGVIIPDLPPEEGRAFIKLANKHNLDVICFISPTTSPERIKYIAPIAKGFIYYVSLTGVTGPRQALPLDLKGHLKVIKKITSKPVCVGFGISGPRQVKQIYSVASGVIVGSAIVKKIKDNIGKPDLVKRVSKYVSGLKDVQKG
jgi:tryptophan synthase alpha chain